MRDKLQGTQDSETIHVKVTVTKNGGKYDASYDPKVIQVNSTGAVINFKLVTPTPDDVVVSAVTIRQKDQDQLSTPSISKNGKQVTLSDDNTLRASFNLDFSYKSRHEQSLRTQENDSEIMDYPVIENNPPGLERVMLAAAEGMPENNPPG
jgi:hypothetical protein